MEEVKDIKKKENTKLFFTQKIKSKWKKEAEDINPIIRFLIIVFAIFVSMIISVILKEAFNISLISFLIFYIIFYNGLIKIKNIYKKNK